ARGQQAGAAPSWPEPRHTRAASDPRSLQAAARGSRCPDQDRLHGSCQGTPHVGRPSRCGGGEGKAPCCPEGGSVSAGEAHRGSEDPARREPPAGAAGARAERLAVHVPVRLPSQGAGGEPALLRRARRAPPRAGRGRGDQGRHGSAGCHCPSPGARRRPGAGQSGAGQVRGARGAGDQAGGLRGAGGHRRLAEVPVRPGRRLLDAGGHHGPDPGQPGPHDGPTRPALWRRGRWRRWQGREGQGDGGGSHVSSCGQGCQEEGGVAACRRQRAREGRPRVRSRTFCCDCGVWRRGALRAALQVPAPPSRRDSRRGVRRLGRDAGRRRGRRHRPAHPVFS
ncbi:unnamed protein product, partial [Prorocentrum cordatum]